MFSRQLPRPLEHTAERASSEALPPPTSVAEQGGKKRRPADNQTLLVSRRWVFRASLRHSLT